MVPARSLVGGSEPWHFGFNYSDWAFQNAPFYVNDVLVFKYDPPSEIRTSTKCSLATGPVELSDVRPVKSQDDCKRYRWWRGGFRVCAEEVEALLFC
ncbi:Plastocyanin-like domain protein [Melia azedarach]|uniref:Plastocyanin-like domain protein n=1 Tax=Melia azedarach TaxID=155640 RepID=A0ACC1XY27_MELAZ|nr:Plastocyanin-like domain protein [Melia azedarach]